jgi:glycosyltransferase involved in cell wall biosynthesis
MERMMVSHAATAKPVRILHIAESARGGVGSYLNEMIPAIDEWQANQGLGWRARVLMPVEDRSMLERVPDALVETYSRNARDLPAFGRLAIASWRVIGEFRPDIIHLHSTFAGAIIRPLLVAARRWFQLNLGIVYSPHGFAFQITGSSRRQRVVARIERRLAALTTRIVVLSDAERAECVNWGFPSDRLIRIYNGSRPEQVGIQPAGWNDPRLKVLFVGRFDRQKGLDVLLEAARLAPDQICVRCAGTSVVGGGAAVSLPDNVEALGWLNETQVAAQFASADVVAIPSRWEGFGLAAIEAMRAGVPVVASRVGGLPEVLEDGVTGRLVPPDDPIALLAALTSDNAAARARMGAAGRQRFLARFTAQRSAEQVGQVYRDVLAGRGGW